MSPEQRNASQPPPMLILITKIVHHTLEKVDTLVASPVSNYNAAFNISFLSLVSLSFLKEDKTTLQVLLTHPSSLY